MPTYAKKFRVMAITLRSNMKRRLVGIEYNPAVYASGAGDPLLSHLPDAFWHGGSSGAVNVVGRVFADGGSVDNNPEGDPIADTTDHVSPDWTTAGRLYKLRSSDRIVYKSDSYGAAGSWTAVGVAAPAGAAEMGKKFLRLSNGWLIVDSSVGSGSNDVRVALSEDQGATWTNYAVRAASGTKIRDYQLWESPGTAGMLFCCFRQNEGAGWTSWVYRSLDFGKTWALKLTLTDAGNNEMPHALFISTTGVLLVHTIVPPGGTGSANLIRRSPDNGDTWTIELTTTTAFGDNGSPVRTTFAQAFGTGRLFFAGKWFSDDGGDTWTELSTKPHADSTRAMGQTGGAVFAALGYDVSGDSKRTQDGGASWAAVTSLQPLVFLADQTLAG